MESQVKFRDWVFKVDKEATQAAYASAVGGADECTCEECRNFAIQRGSVYPEQVRFLFNDLCIDFQKESEGFTYVKWEEGLLEYSDWFQFKGSIIEEVDCDAPLPNGGSSVTLSEITPSFAMGFTYGEAPSHFENSSGLVQIEFSALVPWSLSKTA